MTALRAEPPNCPAASGFKIADGLLGNAIIVHDRADVLSALRRQTPELQRLGGEIAISFAPRRVVKARDDSDVDLSSTTIPRDSVLSS